jgi:hypothetical protein
MKAGVFFRATVPGGTPTEGLELAVVNGGQVAVAIQLDGRTQRIVLDRFDALDLAAVLRARLARRRALRLVEDRRASA